MQASVTTITCVAETKTGGTCRQTVQQKGPCPCADRHLTRPKPFVQRMADGDHHPGILQTLFPGHQPRQYTEA